ncbi:MAG: hypothetical protein M3R30_04695 [Candidatus Eremiobacteraeota bacterium]|nr:hypothetical protein [Candidatus Eremiobacteraeota bacterium]
MIKSLSCAILVAAMLVPSAAFATPVEAVPQRLMLEIGGRVFGEVSASTKSMSIALGESSCFSATPASHDILRISGMRKQETERGAKMAFDVRAHKAGRCTIVFTNGRDSSSVSVVVEPEKP